MKTASFPDKPLRVDKKDLPTELRYGPINNAIMSGLVTDVKKLVKLGFDILVWLVNTQSKILCILNYYTKLSNPNINWSIF